MVLWNITDDNNNTVRIASIQKAKNFEGWRSPRVIDWGRLIRVRRKRIQYLNILLAY